MAVLITASIPSLAATPPFAHASTATCTGTPDDPVFPNYDSDKILATYTTKNRSEVDIRRGYYCVPTSAQGDPALEADQGLGFGLDKVQNRHYIGRPQDGWHEAEAIRAVKFVLSAPTENINSKTDDWGFGWNFKVWAIGGTECPKATHNPDDCKNKTQVPVIAASTEGGADHDPRGGMPAGDPLGLQTVYCDYGQKTRLRCDLWVTAALLKGAEGQKIN
ncbi:hypothetical protein ACWESM_16310 [Nocardia sp. NPDC003999]